MIRPLPLPTAAGADDARRAQISRDALPYLAAAFLVLAAWLGYDRLFPIPVFPMDDAYIVIHNARALLSGTDPNYPGSSPLTGATSLVHLALVTGLMLALKPLAALSASLWISVGLYAVGLVRLARVNGLCRVTSVLVAVLGLTAGEAPHQLVNGLETGLMLAAVTWTLALLSGPGAPRLGVPMLCGVLPFIRPDLLPLALLFFGVQIARRRAESRSLPDLLRGVGRDLAVAGLCALPWALWSWAEDGSVLPQTMNAKRFFFAQAGWPAGVKAGLVLKGVSRFAADLGLLTVFAVFLGTTRLGRIGIGFGGALLGAYFLQFPGALATYEGRYLFPLLPFILLGAVYALRQPRPALRLGAALIFALSLGQSLLNAPGFWAKNVGNCAYTVHDLDGVAGWCSRNLPADATLLVIDAGYISCKTKFRLVDMVGLKTPGSMRYHEALTYPSCGRDRFLAVSEIARRGRAGYLLDQDERFRNYYLADGLRAAGWDVRLINADYAFKVYALRPPAQAEGNAPRPSGFHPPLIIGEGVLN